MELMLSATAVYALRAMIYLAVREGAGPVRVGDVAEALGVPRNYLSKVLHALGKEGALRSLRGPHGGFELAVPAASLTLLQIVRPFDEMEAHRGCLLGQGECSDGDPCVLHDRWRGVSADMAAFFADTSLEEVVRDTERLGAILGR